MLDRMTSPRWWSFALLLLLVVQQTWASTPPLPLPRAETQARRHTFNSSALPPVLYTSRSESAAHHQFLAPPLHGAQRHIIITLVEADANKTDADDPDSLTLIPSRVVDFANTFVEDLQEVLREQGGRDDMDVELRLGQDVSKDKRASVHLSLLPASSSALTDPALSYLSSAS